MISTITNATLNTLTEADVEEEGNDATAIADWTLMIYMSGDNELSHHCIRALSEIKAQLSPDTKHIRVTAQIDPEDSRMKTRRFVINKKVKKSALAESSEAAPVAVTEPLASQSLGKLPAASKNGRPVRLDEDLIDMEAGEIKFTPEKGRASAAETPKGELTGETNMADPKTLFDFISRSIDECPARHYMLVLDGHAAGVEEGFLLKDQNPAGSMSLTGLSELLKRVKEAFKRPLDILGLDTCLMNMLEISFEFDGLVDFIVGSQGLVPGRGWPYAAILNALETQQPKGVAISAKSLAETIVSEFINSYIENTIIGGLSVDVGALKVGESKNVAKEVHLLATSLMNNLINPVDLEKLRKQEFKDSEKILRDENKNLRDQIILSHLRAQSFNGELYVDLWDFCELLKGYFKEADEVFADEIVNGCQAVQTAVDNMTVKSCFAGIESQHSHGVSIYFPWSEMFPGYKDLNFAKSGRSDSSPEGNGTSSPEGNGTGWFEFLLAYLHTTRRETRSIDAFKFRDNRRDPPWKKDPPYHGPSQTCNSMRNPPREYPQITDCLNPDNEDGTIGEANRAKIEILNNLAKAFSIS